MPAPRSFTTMPPRPRNVSAIPNWQIRRGNARPEPALRLSLR
jgi:hypothetical protein